MLWQVMGSYNKRHRQFQVVADTAELAAEEALHMIANHYALRSGTFGNEVWVRGKVHIINEKLEQHLLY